MSRQTEHDEVTLTAADYDRYSRHIVLPEFGVPGQLKLKAAKVLVVGVGGLGSPVSLYLAAAGIGQIGIAEFDTVDLSNLQRQVLYTTEDVAQPKVNIAKQRVLDLNPSVTVETFDVTLSADNAVEIMNNYDVIVDCTDNFPTRYLINDACVLLGKPYVYGSIFKFEGQIAVFGLPDSPCYRCLYPEPPPADLVPSCSEGGVLGVLPGIVGAMQATEAIKLVSGIGKLLKNRFLLINALDMRFDEFKLSKDPNCPACGELSTLTKLTDYAAACDDVPLYINQPVENEDNSAMEIRQITPTELKERLDANEAISILDVREPSEWEISNLERYGATLIPQGQVASRITELTKDAETVVVCRSGGRSSATVMQLTALGFENLWNLEGGINRWAREVDPDLPVY
jgi:molybdopterin/thiamine biosynthesis adenylyltransferase/rhodanese-related sulfurtransferase